MHLLIGQEKPCFQKMGRAARLIMACWLNGSFAKCEQTPRYGPRPRGKRRDSTIIVLFRGVHPPKPQRSHKTTTDGTFPIHTYVDQILRGAKPGDLPVQTPTKYETVRNSKTVKNLGLIASEALLVAADEIIE